MSTPVVTFSNEAGPSSPCSGATSSPSRFGRAGTVGREGIVPLGAAKTVVALTTRRGVIFSPANETRTFDLNDSILPLKDAPPASIRSYADINSDPVCSSSSPAASSSRAGTPLAVRSILKSRAAQIRVAASVEEGTLQNKEPARLLVCGQRPRLVARDSFQLATMRTAASDGVDQAKGKGKAVARTDEAPGSDDSAASDELPSEASENVHDGSSEMEEEVEAPGTIGQYSLINIILDGAEDLLTLEEAYAVLTSNMRARIPTNVPESEWPEVVREELRTAVSPIRDEAPAMVRAMQRDLQRVLGKVPGVEAGSSARESSPFRGLMPLKDDTPTNRSRMTPSPTPIPNSKRTDSAVRKGYTEAEVRYRREAAGVGAATLRFIALVMHVPALFKCFSDADITSVLELVLSILRTPSLPTPNPKRTFYTSLTVLGGLQVSHNSVLPIKEKIARALESALTDGLGLGQGSPTAKDSNGQIKKESFTAAINLFSTYPTIFLAHHAEFLPTALKGLHSPQPLTRMRSSALVTVIATAKLNALSGTSDKDAWTKNKVAAQKLEIFVVSHFKSVARNKATSMYAATGEKKTEWTELERVFKETVGNANDVAWACATWSTVVTLMGSAYASSGLAPAFDHIMDRSLQPSTNVVRPLLARVAWSHAIYAYLSSGSSMSLSEDGEIITSYRPFPSVISGDHSERIKTVQLPVDLALSLALDTQNFSRVERDGRWAWQRAEKAKKFQWLNTCGLGAAAVVYAYSGTALYHRDQPAKEMMALSGLPSSDGAAVPESARQEATLERLDRAWDRVVRPLIKSFGAVCAVDRMKVHGWGLLDAILNQTTPATTEAWSLDRLISAKYLSGELFSTDKADKEESMDSLLDTVDKEAIRPNEIPAWGANWVVRRIDSVLALFEDLLTGIGGLSEPDLLRWIGPEDGKLIPSSLSRMWTNVLRAVAATPKDAPEYTTALTLITRHLLQVFNRDPTTHVPVSALSVDGKTVADADTLRFGLFSHLFRLTREVLGPEVIGATRMKLGPTADKVDMVIFNTSFGSVGTDGAKEATMAGCLLGQLCRAQVLSFPLQPAAMELFKGVIDDLLRPGPALTHSGKLLGDMANAMPFVFHEQEELQLVVWRALSWAWVHYLEAADPSKTAPSTTHSQSQSTTNHTGALLVSLLSCPFRDRAVTSSWHQKANRADLITWQCLVASTVRRFRSRGVGPNLGVLESLAGHLTDFLEANEKTSSSTITLSCLAAATTHMKFVARSVGRGDDHFGVNESYVPGDWLGLISGAMLESYPRAESLVAVGEGSQALGGEISPAVYELLKSLRGVVDGLPEEVVWDVVMGLKDAVAVWMRDELSLVKDRADAVILDELYISLLTALGFAISAGHIKSSAQTMDDLIDLFAPRLNRGISSAVPEAFKTFYEKSFARVRAEEMSEEVRGFMEELLGAVPGLVEVPGLCVNDTFSLEESQARFPHALDVPARQVVEPRVLVDATVDLSAETAGIPTGEDVLPVGETSEEYDADVSQTQQNESASHALLARGVAGNARAMPAISEEVSEKVAVVVPAPTIPASEKSNTTDDAQIDETRTPHVHSVPTSPADESDVFGPTTSRRFAKSRKARGKGKKRALGSTGETESLPESKRFKAHSTASPACDPSETTQSLPLPIIPTDFDAQVKAEEDVQCDEEECISVQSPSPPPPPPSRPIARKSHFATSGVGPSRVYVDLSQMPDSDDDDDNADRMSNGSQASRDKVAPGNKDKPSSSLFNSARLGARALLARVPSLFSPSAVSGQAAAAGAEALGGVRADGVDGADAANGGDGADDAPILGLGESEGALAAEERDEVAEQLRSTPRSTPGSTPRSTPGLGDSQTQSQSQSQIQSQSQSQTQSQASASSTAKKSKKRGKGRKSAAGAAAAATEKISKVKAEEVPKSSAGKRKAPVHADTEDVFGGDGNGNGDGDGDDDDELLLSPESARKRRREEEGDIAKAVERSASLPHSPAAGRTRSKRVSGVKVEGGDGVAGLSAAAGKAADKATEKLGKSAEKSAGKSAEKSGKKKRVKGWVYLEEDEDEQDEGAEQVESGQFADAEETQRLNRSQRSQRSQRIQPAQVAQAAPPAPPTPVQRTAQQTRLLRMMEDASNAEHAVESLDQAGVWELLRHLERVREAAQRNLRGVYEAERRGRRERERGARG